MRCFAVSPKSSPAAVKRMNRISFWFVFLLYVLGCCERKASIVCAAEASPLSLTPAPFTSATQELSQPTATPSPQSSRTPASVFMQAAQPIRAAVLIVSVFDATGHLSSNGHGFFVSRDGQFVTDRSVVAGGVNAVAKVADGAIYNVSGAVGQTATQNLVAMKADASHWLPFLVPSAGTLPETGEEVAIVLSAMEPTNPVLLEEKINARFADDVGEWFEVTPPLSKTIAGAPVINQRGELIGVVTFRSGSNACVIRPAVAVATLVSQVSPNATASWHNVPAAASPRTATPSKTPVKASKLVYAPPPRYPSDARQPRDARQASGSFRVSFDADGRAVGVQTIRSTGNSVLDQSALSALHEWRAEPGHEWSLVVPVTFKP
jgi:TonB family protein